ncbi:PMEI domain-containing protein [Heracleum sosnowskyi]|uniref:PMEI domain-containing protein n=1 Tax=Heracleum sosnowskyi TaxID=360622 RepID=A0AAD8HC36_9APIA|nr:PMEI domain-containing protein [Heracleum sosnowskyi]
MESKTHLINGYSQLSHHPHKPATTYRRETTAVSLLILLTLLTVSALTYISTTSTKPPPSLSTEPDPALLFNTSLYISLTQLENISSLPQTLITDSTDTRTLSALHDCEILFDDAVTQLNNSINSLTGGPGEVLAFTRTKIRELNAWISAAMTDQETCVDGLEEMGSTVCDEVRVKVQLSKQCMSDSLAILAKIQPVEMFGRFLQ